MNIADSQDAALINEIQGTIRSNKTVDLVSDLRANYLLLLYSEKLPGMDYRFYLLVDNNDNVFIQDFRETESPTAMPAGKLLTAWIRSRLKA